MKEQLLVTWKALPTLLLPVIILGGIYGGIFTPTESATVGVVYSFVLALVYHKVTVKSFIDSGAKKTIETFRHDMLFDCWGICVLLDTFHHTNTNKDCKFCSTHAGRQSGIVLDTSSHSTPVYRICLMEKSGQRCNAGTGPCAYRAGYGNQ